MCDLYEKITSLCKQNGISITTMCKESGLSRAPLSDLKMGRSKTLSSASLSKIANYFGVSIDYLLGNTEQKEKASIPKDEREITLDDFTFAIFSHKKQPAGYHIRRAFFYFTIFCALLIISRIPSFNSSISFNCDSYKAF